MLVLWCPDWPLDPDGARAFEQVVSLVEELCPRVEVLHPVPARSPVLIPPQVFRRARCASEKNDAPSILL